MSNQRIWILGIAVLAIVAGISPARAQWSAQVTGPDVFGNTTVVASVSNDSGNMLVIQCDQNDTLELAYILPGTASDMDAASKSDTTIPAELLLKIDDNAVMKFSAEMKPWNNTFIGVVASGKTADIVNAVNAIGKGTDRVSVGATVMGSQQSDTFDLENSTSAMTTAMTECKLGAIQGSSGSNDATPQ